MHESGRKILDLMFRPNEKVCVSHNKFGWHCIDLENAKNGPVVLVSQNPNLGYEYPKSEELLLVALNPIQGFREDANCTAYRNFLVEMDTGTQEYQLNHIKSIGMPYSAAIFSGNKSLHFLISLEKDIPNEKIYRMFAEWILNIVTLADQMTKNPSRSIRIPGAFREPGKQQMLVEYNGPISILKLTEWLNQHPKEKPKKHEKRKISKENIGMDKVKHWVRKKVVNGIDSTKGRNQQWYVIAIEFALAGYTEEETIDELSAYFVPEKDFKEKEWLTTIRSAFKNAEKRQ